MTNKIEDYIKLAEAPNITDQANRRLIDAIPAMAKALIEAEAHLESVQICIDLETVHSAIDKALATIQRIKENG